MGVFAHILDYSTEYATGLGLLIDIVCYVVYLRHRSNT
ncbi:hypothetical protein KIPB_013527, partial [Kipferlia bialata]|eukprot:g13527.t1